MNDGRAPHGARGLKCRVCFGAFGAGRRRAPHGARGLKFDAEHIGGSLAVSRPARGAWIEIVFGVFRCGELLVAPRTGRVD